MGVISPTLPCASAKEISSADSKLYHLTYSYSCPERYHSVQQGFKISDDFTVGTKLPGSNETEGKWNPDGFSYSPMFERDSIKAQGADKVGAEPTLTVEIRDSWEDTFATYIAVLKKKN